MNYIYNQQTSMSRAKANTKNLFFSIVAATTLMLLTMVPAFAATPVVSENASNKACFGQWRASTADGSVIASRKGANASQNVTDKEYCTHSAPIPLPNGGYPAVWADAPMGSIIDSWGFYNRESTSYVAFKIAQSGGNVPYALGNPKVWPSRSEALGIPVSSTPTVGTAAISLAGFYGHAMYVEDIYADGSIRVSHYNYDFQGNYSETVILPTVVAGLKFIHF